MLKLIKAKANELNADVMYYLSHSYDGTNSGKFKADKCKNPLSYKSKLKYCRDAAPFVTFVESSANNFYQVLGELYQNGYEEVYLYGGEDRIDEFERAKDYNGKLPKTDKNYFSFKTLEIINAGNRDENSENIEEQASASLLRKCVKDLDFEKFEKYAGTQTLTEEMFDELLEEMKIEM